MQAQPSVFHPVLGPCSMSRLAWLEDIDITSSHQCSCHALYLLSGQLLLYRC